MRQFAMRVLAGVGGVAALWAGFADRVMRSAESLPMPNGSSPRNPWA